MSLARDALSQAPPCPACGRATAWSDAVCPGCDEALADIDPTFTPDVQPFQAGMWDEAAVMKAWQKLERPEPRVPFRQVAIVCAVLVVIGVLSPISASGLFDWLDRPEPDVVQGPAVLPGAADLADRAIAPQPAYGPVPVGHGQVGLAFEWEHAGTTWSWTFELDPAVVEHYRSVDRQEFSDAYAAFVLDPGDDAIMASLADRLREVADTRGWDDQGLLAFALSFVQHLPYATDAVGQGYDEYPRYPVETLVDDGADCEDTSILFASLVQQLGFDAVLLSPPGHMGVGVPVPHGAADAQHDGIEYWYAETTGEGWRIGDVPPTYEGQPLQVHALDARPVLGRPQWEAGHADGRYEIRTSVRNVGVMPAHDLVLYAAFDAGDGQVWDQASCAPLELAVGATARCTVRLKAPPAGEESRLIVSAWATGVEPKTSRSEAFTA